MEKSFGSQSVDTPVQSDQISGNLLTPAVTVIPRGLAKILRDSEPLVPEPTPEELAQDHAEMLFEEADTLLDETGVLTRIDGAGNAVITQYSHEVTTDDGETYYAFIAEYTDRWTRTMPPRRNPLTGIRVIHSRTNDPNNLDVSLEDGGINFKEDDDNVGLYSLDSTVGQPAVNSKDNLAYVSAIIADIKKQHTESKTSAEQLPEPIKRLEKEKKPLTKNQLIALGAGAVAVATGMLGIAKYFTESTEQPSFSEYDTSYIQPKEPNIYFGDPSVPFNPTPPPKEYLAPKGDAYMPLPDAPPAVITDAPQPPNRPVPPTEVPSDWKTPPQENSHVNIFVPRIFPDSISPR